MTKTAPAKKTVAAPASMFPTSESIKAAVAVDAAPATATAAKPAAKAPAKPRAKPAAPVAAAKPVAAKPAAAKAEVVAKPAPAAAKPAPAAAKPATKAAAKPAAKAAVKPAAAKKAPAAKIAAAVKEKARKPKLVRDSFTMPEAEYEVLGQVKKACLKAGFEIKKSELLRIGVALISQIDLATLQNVLAGLPQLKTGRPKKD